MNWNNRLTDLLKIEYPFIQAPMLGYTTPQMVATAANSKVLGSLPLGLMSDAKATEAIHSVKKLTQKPFSVNVFAHPEMKVLPDVSLATLHSYYQNYGLPFPHLPEQNPYPSYEGLVDIIIEEGIPVVSFTFGIPSPDILHRLKRKNTVLIGVATSTEEAKKIEQEGLDIVVAQGIEAGGHRASFLSHDLPQVGLISLLPQIVDSVKLPVVAAGGLAEARSIAAAFILGAEGVQIGSALLRSKESAASAIHKALIQSSTDTGTTLTNAWTGRLARMIPNDFINGAKQENILPYPYQNYMTGALRQYGKETNKPDIQTLYAGQSAKYASAASTSEIITQLISETEKVFKKTDRICK